MPLRPSILKESEKILGSTKVNKFISEKEDYLAIEDSSGRQKINHSHSVISINNFITGIAVAFKGSLDERGLFCVHDYLFYQPEYTMYEEINQRISKNSTPNLPQMISNVKKGNEIIVFISGLLFGYNNDIKGQLKLSRNLLMNFLKGKLLFNQDIAVLASKISKIVIVGNSVSSPDDIDEVDRGSFRKKEINQTIYNKLSLNYDLLDDFINELANYVPVDLMPGKSDNVSSYFPSVPMTPILFHESKKTINKTFHLVTNPYYFNYENISYLGTSGENIQSIFQATNYEDGIQIMEKTLDWGNISPSAPDIQRCSSFEAIDPLVIKQMPNVYFCGNQNKYNTKLYYCKGIPIRLICIPDFSKTYSIALLDSITLDTCEFKLQYNTE